MAKINGNWPWPNDVGLRGTYPEEVKALRPLERNVEASPVPDAEPGQLLDPKRSSDNLRMGEPRPVEDNDPLGSPLLHVSVRRVLFRRKNRGWQLFEGAVDEAPLDGEIPDHRREQMGTMLRRERAMLELLERYNSLAEAVYARLLSEAKG